MHIGGNNISAIGLNTSGYNSKNNIYGGNNIKGNKIYGMNISNNGQSIFQNSQGNLNLINSNNNTIPINLNKNSNFNILSGNIFFELL